MLSDSAAERLASFRPQAVHFATFRCGVPINDAEDIVQEAMADIHAHGAVIDPVPMAYLLEAVKRCAADYYRARGRAKRGANVAALDITEIADRIRDNNSTDALTRAMTNQELERMTKEDRDYLLASIVGSSYNVRQKLKMRAVRKRLRLVPKPDTMTS